MEDVRIPWWKTDLGDAELAGVERSLRARRINQGAICAELEHRLAERLGVPYVALTTSGSAALLLSLWSCGVGRGDEVIVPAAGFIASAHAARWLGARVVLADVLPDRPLVDPAAVEPLLTPRTRALVAAHLNGAAADVEALTKLAAPHGVAVVEDAAQAFASCDGAATLGTQGDAAAFSMGLTKLLTTGEGGFAATRSDARAEAARRFRNQGVLDLSRNEFDAPGFNLRFTDLLAGFGLAQLDRLDEKMAGVQRVHRSYCEGLEGVAHLEVIEVRTGRGELPLWTEVLCADRDRVVRALAARGIQARPFHPSLGRSAHLDATGHHPRAEIWGACGLVLPSGPDQPDVDLRETIDVLRGLSDEIPERVEAVKERLARAR